MTNNLPLIASLLVPLFAYRRSSVCQSSGTSGTSFLSKVLRSWSLP